MTPAQFEWEQEKLEFAFVGGQIDVREFKRVMKELGYTDAMIDSIVKDLQSKRCI